jgi:hypothetical protein
MQTECSAERSMFGRVEGRSVVEEFVGGALTSDAGGLLLGAADQRLGLVRRIARCFRDATRGSWSTQSPRSSGSACSALRSATRI